MTPSLDKTSKITDFIYHEQDITSSSGFIRTSCNTFYTSEQYGTRADNNITGRTPAGPSLSTFALPAEKLIIVVMWDMKKYKRHPLPSNKIAEMKREVRDRLVRKYTAGEHRSLGRKQINGIEADGIEFNDVKFVDVGGKPVKSYTGRLWVDPRNELPVMIEHEGVVQDGDHEVHVETMMSHFRWNVGLRPEVFTPDIPEDFTEL